MHALDPHIAEKDAVKAHDATIAAIGIVAVLIINVAYVGAAQDSTLSSAAP